MLCYFLSLVKDGAGKGYYWLYEDFTFCLYNGSYELNSSYTFNEEAGSKEA